MSPFDEFGQFDNRRQNGHMLQTTNPLCFLQALGHVGHSPVSFARVKFSASHYSEKAVLAPVAAPAVSSNPEIYSDRGRERG